jgi:hypothetical protein
MFNLKLNDKSAYIEIGQRNALRWKTLFREGDIFTDQSGWIKCKDFFNDTVAFFKAGTVFSIYGYKNNIKKNEEGVYILLKYINDMPSFKSNMEIINQQLKKDLGCVLEMHDTKEKDEQIVLIPTALWETTYRISLVTFVIRLCNYGYKYKEWYNFFDQEAPACQLEHAFTPQAMKMAKELGFKVPEKFAKYWYYAGETYNSEKAPTAQGGIIHNNGCSNWNMYMEKAK